MMVHVAISGPPVGPRIGAVIHLPIGIFRVARLTRAAIWLQGQDDGPTVIVARADWSTLTRETTCST